MLLSKEEKEYIRSAFNENRKSVDIRIAFLLDIIEKLDEIEEKLDALKPTLDIDEVVYILENKIKKKLQSRTNDISENELKYLRETAETKVKTMFGNSQEFQKVLAMAKEVKEEKDIKKVASLVATKEWIVIFSNYNSFPNETTFVLIKI